MEIIHALTIAVVEGLTEFIPVSSTGHMIIVSHFLGIESEEFVKTFEIAIQLGAIGAVFSMYWRTFLLDWQVGLRVLAAFLPTSIIGFILYKVIKEHLMGNVAIVAWAMLLGGIFLVIFEYFYKGKKAGVNDLASISYPQALIIGLCQALAVIPGVSRSAATILGGLGLGINRSVIVEFSFLLAVPTMMAATGLDLLKSSGQINGSQWGILAVGFGTAFVVAFATVKFLLIFVRKNNFIGFGFYRIAAGLALLWILAK